MAPSDISSAILLTLQYSTKRILPPRVCVSCTCWACFSTAAMDATQPLLMCMRTRFFFRRCLEGKQGCVLRHVRGSQRGPRHPCLAAVAGDQSVQYRGNRSQQFANHFAMGRESTAHRASGIDILVKGHNGQLLADSVSSRPDRPAVIKRLERLNLLAVRPSAGQAPMRNNLLARPPPMRIANVRPWVRGCTSQ